MPTKRTVISIAPKALLDTPENAPAIAVAAADNAVPTTPTTTMTTTAAPAAPTPKPSATTSLKNPRTPPATSKRAEEMAPPPAKRRRTVAASAAAAGTAPPASRPGRVTMTTAASSKTAGQATDVADDNNAKPAEGAMTGPPPPPSKRGGAAAAGRGSAASAARKTPAAATAATRKQTSVTNAKAIALTSRRAAKPQPPLPIHLQMQMEANAIAAKGGAAANHGAAASKTTKPISATSSATNTTNSTTAKPTPYPAGRTHFTGAKGSAPLKTLSSVATMVPKSAPRPTSTTPYAAAPTTLKTLQRPNGNAMKPMRPISSTTTPSTTKLNDSQTSIIAGVNAANTAPESNPFLAQDPSLPHSTIDEIINEANDLLQAASEAQSLGRLRMSASYLLLAHARLVGLGRRFDRSRCVEMGGNGAAVGAGAGAGAGFGGAMSKGIPSSVGSGANGGANAHVNSNAPSFPPPMEIHSSNSNQGPPSTLSAPSAGPPPQTQPQTPQETAPTAKSAPRNPQKPLSQQSHIQQPDPQQPQSQRPLHRHPPPHPSNPHPQHPRPPPSHLQRPYPYPHPQHPHPPQPVHTLPPLVQTANLPLPNLEHDAAMMEQLARTAMELHHKRTGRGMQHEALLEKQKLLKMAKSKDGSDGGNEAVAGVEENTDVRLGGEEESAEGNKGKGRGKGKGKGKGKTKAESGAERGSSPMKRKGGRGKKPPTLVMHTLPCARLDAKKIMHGYG